MPRCPRLTLATAIAVILVLGVSVGPAPARAQIPPAVPVAVLGSGSEASNYSIQIGTTSYVAPDLEPASGQQPTGGFQILVLDRATLALLSNENTFLSSSFVAVVTRTIDASGNPAVQVGATIYTSPALDAQAQGGYQVVVLAAAQNPLAVASNTSYATNYGGSSSKATCEGQDALNKFLNAQVSPTQLVIVSSIGAPGAVVDLSDCKGSGSLTDSIQALGGTGAALGQNYSLVGYPPGGAVAPEASSMEIAGSSAQLTVVLQPNRGGVFSPVNGDFIGAGTVNYGLYVILAQPPVAWPVPAAGNAEQAAALQYISYVLQCPITLPKTPPTPPASFPRARRVGSRIARTFAPSTAP